MYLKSLTLKGFKSFASSTTLQLEPGITCIVGPNGSGKSNVVDALAWVMGEASAKTLRGGKMDDVIFAGTAGRSPLGRAEVILTIDNSDGSLPIEYAEVTISRTMFRSGGSEYAINGRSCRLLDVQELLADSGIGREMHVIVGQGQLDAILHATPEERRGFIEEAAGVLKHRKRKEKALRKVDSTDANLTRLNDLLGEIRRQLKPLGRQAEVARRAATVQADVREAKARLLADDLTTARAVRAAELADESALLARKADVEQALAQAREREAELEERLRVEQPQRARTQELWFSLTGLGERFRGTAQVAAERVRQADQLTEPPTGRDPDQTEAAARQADAEERALSAEVDTLRAELDETITARGRAEEAAAAEQRRVAEGQRAEADRREAHARLLGKIHAEQSRATAAAEELGRLVAAHTEATGRAVTAQSELDTFHGQLAGLEQGDEGLERDRLRAAEVLSGIEEELTRLRAHVAEADRERSSWSARAETLQLGLARHDAAAFLLRHGDSNGESWSRLAALVEVKPGFETAIAVALGTAADAVVVEDQAQAAQALTVLRQADAGRASVLISANLPGEVAAAAAASATASTVPALPAGVRWAAEVVAPGQLDRALSRLLSGVAIADEPDAALALVRLHPQVTVVTTSGELISSRIVTGGSGNNQSALEIQAAFEEAVSRTTHAAATFDHLTTQAAECADKRNAARLRLDQARAQSHSSEVARAGLVEQVRQLAARVQAAHGDAARLDAAIAQVEQRRGEALTVLAELSDQLETGPGTGLGAGLDPGPDPAGPDPAGPDREADRREELAQVATAARGRETDVRLALRTAEERARSLHGRAESLFRAATSEREARARALVRRERIAREAEVARAVGHAIGLIEQRLATLVAEAVEERTRLERSRAEAEQQLADVRRTVRSLSTQIETLTSSAHRDELARQQQDARIEQILARAMNEVGLDPDSLLAEYGHDPASAPFDREEQSQRLRRAERDLATLGTVNPLALEEFSALEERHQFLTTQVEDLKRTRKDLLDIVRQIDSRVEQVLTEAYRDVSAAFDQVFTRLFPGGEGKLVLTEPDQILATGVEVEARPAGKKVKRLSLLSGGERSLVAVAFLVALFKARPSPFYILDEVEAALDDTNLGRLLEVYDELREHSQLLVITHQKRTMEIGDALYGVTMQGDGVSTVISQRLRGQRPEAS